LIAESVRLAGEVQSTGVVQSRGIHKIRQSIMHISTVSDQNLQTTKQNEDTASKLSELGNKLQFQSETTSDTKG
jgi:methyl-accepting chemotaxis protein